MVGAAVFGRLLNDLKIDCSPHGPAARSGRGVRTRESTVNWRNRPWLTRSVVKSSGQPHHDYMSLLKRA